MYICKSVDLLLVTKLMGRCMHIGPNSLRASWELVSGCLGRAKVDRTGARHLACTKAVCIPIGSKHNLASFTSSIAYKGPR